MKKLLAITTFVIVTTSNIFTLAWANEYTDVYIRLAGEVEVEEDHTNFYTSAKELSPQPDTKDDTLNKEIKLLPDRAGLLNSNGFKLFGDERNKTGIDGYEFRRIKVVVPEYKANSVTAGDILRSIPAIAITDEQTLGVIIPPFAYFAKKF